MRKSGLFHKLTRRLLKMISKPALLVALALPLTFGSACAANAAHVEFLWSPVTHGALARAEAYGFVLEGDQDHKVCVVAIDSKTEENLLRIDVIDASGKLISSRSYDDFDGSKQCHAAGLDASGVPGEWTFNVYMNHELSATKTIEVARTLEGAAFYKRVSRPYVLGRPNYDINIPPDEYKGRLVWIMHVDATGTVSHVDVEASEGAGSLMKDRAIAAGYLTMFPPDASRTKEPMKIRQEYLLGTD